MRKFDQTAATDAFELNQMLVDFWHELDVHGGRKATQFFTEDCVVEIGAYAYTGHAAMKKQYDDHAEAVRAMAGGREQRHTVSNFRVSFPEKDRATVSYIVVNFSAQGKAPVVNASTPTLVTDCRWECRRGTDGQWLVVQFSGTPIFLGNEPYLNTQVVGR